MVASMFTAAADALAAAVVELRVRAKLSQRELASAVGREQSFIGRIETGQRRVDLVEWITICRACGADPEAEMGILVKRISMLVPAKRRRE
jgi:transcriptional regulator with XRE-family HTH domain